jgi:hypothetical protein
VTDPEKRQPLRPAQFAMLLLASGDLRPRQRARDQQADLAGLELKRLVLDRLAGLDPEPEQLEAALVRIVEQLGPASGPARAIAQIVREEWQAACATPDLVTHLLGEALRQSGAAEDRGRRGPNEH